MDKHNLSESDFKEILEGNILEAPSQNFSTKTMLKIEKLQAKSGTSRFAKILPYAIFAMFGSIMIWGILYMLSNGSSWVTSNLSIPKLALPAMNGLMGSMMPIYMVLFAGCVWILVALHAPKKSSSR